MRITLIVLALVALTGSAALACICDPQVKGPDQEFKSRYPMAQVATPAPVQLDPLGVGAFGFGLLAMAGGMAVARRRA